jgi:death-on-curing protein
MTTEPVWVLPEVAMAVHLMLLADHGGLEGRRDQTLLDSALGGPLQTFSYKEDLSIHDLAAAYANELIQNHPFVDGNKRVALSVAAIFLELNGQTLNAPEPETVVVFEQLAAGYFTETGLANWFSKHCINTTP